jgi:hypothetical protein
MAEQEKTSDPKPSPKEEVIDLGGVTAGNSSAVPVHSPKDGETEDAESHIFDMAKAESGVTDQLKGITDPAKLLDALVNIEPDKLIPWEEMTLPSRGLYYDGKVPGGLVQIKPMGTVADKILATARLAQTGQSIDYLLRNCVQLPNDFQADDLLAGDRTFLLYALRGVTHGNDYEFMITCPNCGTVQNCQYDLNELSNTITRGNPSITEPAKVILPYLSKTTGREVWVGIRFMRGRDVSTLASRQKFNKRIQGASVKTGSGQQPTQQRGPRRPQQQAVTIDNALTENLNLIITSFMGVNDPGQIASLVERLHSSDTAAIREFLRKYSPGIDTTISVTCVDCSTEFKTELPITESFFRPTISGGVRP